MHNYYYEEKWEKVQKLQVEEIVEQLKHNYSARFSSLLYKKLFAPETLRKPLMT